MSGTEGPPAWSDLVRREVSRWLELLDDLDVRPARDAWVRELGALRQLLRELHWVADELEARLAATLDGETLTVDGHVWTGTRERRRRDWDVDALVRAVLDSRRVDRTTGELLDETPVDRLRHVWRLDGRNVRISALRDRGIDPDEYCTVEPGRWRLRDVT